MRVMQWILRESLLTSLSQKDKNYMQATVDGHVWSGYKHDNRTQCAYCVHMYTQRAYYVHNVVATRLTASDIARYHINIRPY